MSKPVIVVGVDGSPIAAEALRWAADQARLTAGTLRVVHAWSPPAIATVGIPPLRLDWSELREQAQAFPGTLVREVLGEDPGIAVVTAAKTGGAAQVLVDESKHADLLVVGSRGSGGLKGMVLGSVGHHCAAHAHCPVVVVHPKDERRRRPVRRERAHAA
ncbi:MAG TPA: universal stress protein [Gaiellaceae bacterium]|jgi:nucleotide-binding universal stress UspA family protein|nr:universal stress protein [Gaiellaceae bacterium]